MGEGPPLDEVVPPPGGFGAVLLDLYNETSSPYVSLEEGRKKQFTDWLIHCAQYLADPALGNAESTSGMPLDALVNEGARRTGQSQTEHLSESERRSLARYGEMPLYLALTDPRQQPDLTHPPVLAYPDVALMVLQKLGVVRPTVRASATADRARAYWKENVFTALQEGVAGYGKLKEKSGHVQPTGMFEKDGTVRDLGYGDRGEFYVEYPTMIAGDELTMRESPHGPLPPVKVRVQFHNPPTGSDEVATPPYLAVVVPGYMALETRGNPSEELKQLVGMKPPWPSGGVSWLDATRGRV